MRSGGSGLHRASPVGLYNGAMNPSRAIRFERLLHVLICGLLAGLALVVHPAAFAAEAVQENSAGVLEYETQSAYSRIRIRKRGDVRTLIFVRDNGYEAWESRVDLGRPQVLQFDYLKFLATSFLFVPQPKAVLIVGLGGGGMVHFLRHVDPKLQIDVVEIDPVVVRLAEQYFNVRTGNSTNIITGDGLKYLAETARKYDVIYLDAFLKPSSDTDGTGAPLSLRTQQFYTAMQTRLAPGGVVAFNLNHHTGLDEDMRNIAAAFPQAYAFRLADEAVVLGATDPRRVAGAEFERRGAELNARLKPSSMSFRDMAQRLRP